MCSPLPSPFTPSTARPLFDVLAPKTMREPLIEISIAPVKPASFTLRRLTTSAAAVIWRRFDPSLLMAQMPRRATLEPPL